MTERRLINDYFPDWNFSDNEESITFTHEGKQHKSTVKVGTNYPFIIFKGKKYYIY